MNIRSFSLAIGTAALLASTAHAQGLLLQVNRANGEMTLTGTAATAVNLGGYRIGSASGTLSVADFDGIRNDVADWVITGTPDAHGVEELLSNAFSTTPVSNAVTYNLGAAYDPSPAIQNAGFGVDVEQGDLSLIFYDTALNTSLAGTVEYLGEKIFNNIGITVDLANGTAIIENESPFNQVITGYLIESSSVGSLNTNLGSFNGVRDEAGGSGFQPPSTLDGSSLGEVDVTGAGIALASGQSYSLGNIGGLNNSLNFSFILKGASELSRGGFVKYLNIPAPLGDFNADGNVDAADYTVWRDNLGALDETAINYNGDGGGIAPSDYQIWKSHFGAVYGGAGSGLAVASTIPEPTGLILTAAVLAIMLPNCRPRRIGLQGTKI
jgi:hypothetical protein